jgi:hypothetical protein
MSKKKTMCYKMHFLSRSLPSGHNGMWVEFHCGWEEDPVREGRSLSKGISLDIDGDRLAEWFQDVEWQIDTFNLRRLK